VVDSASGNSDGKSTTAQISSSVKKVTNNVSKVTTQDSVHSESAPGACGDSVGSDSTPGACGDNPQNPLTQNLYTWSSAGKPSEGVSINPYENDDIALVDIKVYNTRPVPEKFQIPSKGDYCDIHVINIFDPTNFVVSVYKHIFDRANFVVCVYKHIFDRANFVVSVYKHI
jgi:hypothetical protein